MTQRDLMHEFVNNGPAMIVAGLAVVFAAMAWPGIPIAAAIMLIGYGAMVAVLARPVRQELLGVLSLAVYASLGCLAVAAQTHAAVNGSTGRVGVFVLADHFAAATLLALLVRMVLRRSSFFSA